MFTCSRCNGTCSTVPETVRHCLNHFENTNDTNFRCLSINCVALFSNVDGLRKHLYQHLNTKKCRDVPVCKKINKNSNNVLPEIPSIESLSQPDNTSSNLLVENRETAAELPCNIAEHNVSLDTPNNTANIPRYIFDSSTIDKDITHIAAQKISAMYADPFVTKKSVENCCNFTTSLLECVPFQELQQNIDNVLKKYPIISESDCDTIKKSFSVYNNPLYALATEHKKHAYFKKMGSIIEYETFVMDNVPRKNAQGMEEQTEVKGYYFPIEKILQKVFQLPNFYDTLMSYTEQAKDNDEFITSYIASKCWEKKQQHFEGKIVFPLALYVDDFEPNNALGSHKSLYKMGGVYFTLPALPQHIASQLKNVFVTSIHFTDDRKQGNLKKAFQPIINSLKLLAHEGIEIVINGQTQRIYFCLAYIHGDNLGLNELLSFTEGFNCTHYCRFCNASKQQAWTMCKEDKQLLRTKQSYERDVEKNNVRDTGIHSKCIFQDQDIFYDVTDNWVGDVLHDFLEGVCRYEICYLLLDLILKKKLFTLEYLNYRIEYCTYSPNDVKNKPTLFDLKKLKNINVSMSASEMLTFMRYAPIIIGDYVPHETKSWQIFLILREILYICIAPAIRKTDLNKLEGLIEKHHNLVVNEFKVRLKPKHHFLTHYPSIIQNSGPPTQYWTMRQEAKHKVSKSYCKVNSNRMNMLKSVCWKHQMQMSHRFLMNEPVSLLNTVVLPKKATNVTNEDIQSYGNLLPPEYYKKVNKATISNIVFKKNCVLLTNFDHNKFPVLSVVDKIIVHKENVEKVLFLCFELVVNYWDEHYQSYNVTTTDKSVAYSFDQLLVKTPLYMYTTIHDKCLAVHRHAI